MNVVISLYDYTGVAVHPWAQAGYNCFCYDIQHAPGHPRVKRFDGGGSISYFNADLHDSDNVMDLSRFAGQVAFMWAFPVCTDLAVSGAMHFAKKRDADPEFQIKAASYAERCGDLGDVLGCPYAIENPVSVLSTLWRKPDHTFNPYQYGGYIHEAEAEHPTWPEYIAPRDAYPKKTCLWTGNGFVMPEHRPVAVEPGYSRQHKKLGGKSAKTKNIRSATPRGFARAVFEANKKDTNQ